VSSGAAVGCQATMPGKHRPPGRLEVDLRGAARAERGERLIRFQWFACSFGARSQIAAKISCGNHRMYPELGD
jgi:hypothetical protein